MRISTLRLRRRLVLSRPPVSSTATRHFSSPTARPQPALDRFAFTASHSLFAKRPPRPFPPPFNSPSPSSFSDPLSPLRRRRLGYTRAPKERSEGASFLSGLTNGDDAILTTSSHIAVADGIGQWNLKAAGHPALWSRLMLHYWSQAVTNASRGGVVDPTACLSAALAKTQMTTAAAGWRGTTTVCAAVLNGATLALMNVGDSVGFVWRPRRVGWVLRSEEQWHWFDCPRQLGTNSPDTPAGNAVVQREVVQDGDVVVLASDGLVDNLFEEEIGDVVVAAMEADEGAVVGEVGEGGDRGRMAMLADQLVKKAKKVALDPFAESPYMYRSIEEGLAKEGGKLDDISVVTAVVRLRGGGSAVKDA